MTSTAAALALADTAPTPLAERILDTLVHRIGKDARAARPHDWLNATCLTVRDDVIERWMTSTREAHAAGKKRVYYLSLEFLIGRLLRDALSNLGLTEEIAAALVLGVELDLIEEIEPDAALGNGGLGRLAACFMESLSTLDLPAYGYGIRYVNGMFRQRIDDGWQVELPETWLAYGNPWEFQRRESAYPIGFGGEVRAGEAGLTRWQPAETLIAEAFDTPVVGWRGARVNTLRLWNARAVDRIQLDRFNAGDHLGALADASRAETLTRVLYPADSNAAGQELRLRQEYFFSSASLQDIVRRHMQYVGDISSLPDHAAIQLNDTHPAVSVAELMRVLLDQHDLAGDHIYKMDYELMLQQHCDSGADVTVACMEAPRADATGFGVMAIDEGGRITDFVEKPADPPPMPGKPDVSLVSMGIYVFHTRFLFDQLKRDAETPGSSRDFGKDIIPHLVKHGVAVAHQFSQSCVRASGEPQAYWRDVGTVDAYWEANIDLTDVIPQLDLYDHAWPLWTYSEVTPPAKFVHDSEGRRGSAVSSLVSGDCIVSGASLRRTLMFTGVRANSFSSLDEAVVLPRCVIGRNARLSKVVLDRGVVVPEGLVVGEDPELDARRFRRTGKGVCLVTQAMIDRLEA